MTFAKTDRILILGQHLTSRTEAVRDYLLSRADEIYIIGLGSVFLQKAENHLFCYEKNILKKHLVFSHPRISSINIYSLKVIAVFFTYLLDGLKSLLIIGKRFNISIGIARFSGLITAIFKLCGVCKKGIYYSIDYYSVSGKVVWFDRVFMVISEIAERFTIYMCDETWDISHRIPQARKEFGGINERSYSSKHAVVPLGYSEAFFRNKPVPVEKSIVFAGVVVEGQGLELILEILSELSSEFPGIKIKVIGTGPYLPAFKRKVTELSLDRYFTFYGFIEKVDDMLEIISSSHIGISLWDEKKNGLNFYYGDPGKTKLYSVCGLPVIVSNRTVYSQVVSDNHCGIAIDYEKAKLLNAIKSLLGDENKYRDYKSNAVKTAREYCSAEKIFSKVLEPL